MVHNQKDFYKFLYRLINLISLPVALYFAIATRFFTFVIPFDNDLRFLLLYGVISWFTASSLLHYYENSWHSRTAKTIYRTSLVTIIFFAFVGLFSFALKEVAYSRIIISLFALYQWLFVLLAHHLIRYMTTRRGALLDNRKQLLIIGDEKDSLPVLKEVRLHPQWGVDLVGHISDEESSHEKIEYLGKLDKLEIIIYEKSIHEILVLLPMETHKKEIMEVLAIAEREGVRSQLVPHNLNQFNVPLRLAYFGSIITYRVRHIPLDSLYNQLVKRTFDVVCSLAGLLVLSPIFLFTAILIKLIDNGPAFFVQTRTGYNQADFNCYKFRSMTVADRKISDGQQAIQGDNRLLKIGNLNVGELLRKLNIDELPQLLNVLKGDMSLVGPRPHMLAHTDEFKDRLDDYMVRHFVRPGITGMAQVNGFRGPTDTHEKLEGRVQYDIKYMENWTLQLDIQIIIETIFGSKSNKNAF